MRSPLWRWGPVAWALLLAGAVLGLLPSVDVGASVGKLAAMAAAACLYFVVACLSSKALVGLLWALAGASTIVAILADVQVDRNSWKLDALNRPVYAWFSHVPRLNDLAFNQNAVAAFLILVIPFGLALTVRTHGWRRMLAGGMAVFLLLELLLTESRAAMLSLGLAAALLGLYGRGRWRWLALLAPLGAVALLASGLVTLPVTLSWLPTGGSSRERLAIWQSALHMIADAPFTGIGLGMFQRVYPLYILPAYHNIHPHAHNLFLQTWVDAGALGFAGMIGLVGLSVRAMVQVERTPLGIAAAVSTTAVLLHGQVDSYFAGDPRTYAVLFVPLAILAARGAPKPVPIHSRRPAFQLGSIALAPLVLAGGWAPALMWNNVGTIQRLRGDPSAVAFEQALRFWPGDWVAERGLGLASGSIDDLQAALRDGPGDDLAHFELAQALYFDGRTVEAIPEWRRAHAAPYLARLATKQPALAPAQSAEALLGLALAVDPKDPGASDAMAALLARQRRWPELRAFLAQSPPTSQARLLSALVAGQDPPARASALDLGQAYELMGRYEPAEAQYRQVAASDPMGHFRLGELYLAEGRHGKGMAELHTAVTAIPNQEDFRLALARAYRATGDVRGAESQYRVVLNLDPANCEALIIVTSKC